MPLLASRQGRAFFAAVLLFSIVPATGAHAQPKSVSDEARELARDGWKALDAENYRDALDKVVKAEALYHAPTHLLLMGNAQVGLGKLADALATFERLAAEPLPAAAPPAFKEAQETGRKRMKELLARVPSLLIVVESAEAAAAVVTVDGQKVDFASGVAVRFDPGERTIAVTADGFVPVSKKVTLPEKGGVVRVPVALEKVRAPGSPSADPTASPSGSASAGPGGEPVITSRVPAYVTFGVAGASLVVGAITGGLSLSQTSELKLRCPDNRCASAERAAYDQAFTLAHVSTATFLLGGVAAAAGVVLLVVDFGGPPAKPVSVSGSSARQTGAARPRRTSGVRVEPWISIGGLGARGSF